jgi:DNA-binding MarR family transcriptional regulator
MRISTANSAPPVWALLASTVIWSVPNVSLLAKRAQMTKQAMAELVSHLETHGYVVRVPDPADRRAKLVLPTERGNEVVAIAQALVPEIESWVSRILGDDRVQALRDDLEAIRLAAANKRPQPSASLRPGASDGR